MRRPHESQMCEMSCSLIKPNDSRRPLLTILTVGCSLLVVNLLVFVGTFCQHRERSKPKQQAKETTDAGSTSKVVSDTRRVPSMTPKRAFETVLRPVPPQIKLIATFFHEHSPLSPP